MENNNSKTSHHISVCEANFYRIKRLINNFDSNKIKFKIFEFEGNYTYAELNIVSKSKHTLIYRLKQESSSKFNSFYMDLKICFDAYLCEAISYQGKKDIFNVKEKINSKDEKYQQNRFLTEWLEYALFSETTIQESI